MEEIIMGTLMVIGGAEDKRGECKILNRLRRVIDEKKGNTIILTAATLNPNVVAEEYMGVFKELGISPVEALHIHTRDNAMDLANAEKIRKSVCIFMTGGDQLRITSLIGGTEVENAIYYAYNRGALIAGTSAGASVMSETMITEGNDDDSPKKCTLKMAPGLGLLKDVVVDQHFAQRGRIGRLLAAIAQNPHMLGVGIDEDTALIIGEDSTLEVIGSNAITIIDGRDSRHSNVSELKPDEILAFTNVKMHLLPEGYRYNLAQRRAIIGRK